MAACGHCLLLGGGCDKDTIRQAAFRGALGFVAGELNNIQFGDLLPIEDLFLGLNPSSGR
jgi:hypothetical protein